MAFVVATKPTFSAPVVAQVPADGGRFTKVSFSVVFKALDKQAVEELLKGIRSRAKEVAADDSVAPLRDRDLLDDLLVGFGPDVLEEDRTPMAFNPTNVDRLCAIWPIEAAIVKSFFDNYISGPTKN